MALVVEVSGFGVCRSSAPHAIFVICVHQEKYESWTVYRYVLNMIKTLYFVRVFTYNAVLKLLLNVIYLHSLLIRYILIAM